MHPKEHLTQSPAKPDFQRQRTWQDEKPGRAGPAVDDIDKTGIGSPAGEIGDGPHASVSNLPGGMQRHRIPARRWLYGRSIGLAATTEYQPAGRLSIGYASVCPQNGPISASDPVRRRSPAEGLQAARRGGFGYFVIVSQSLSLYSFGSS